MTARLILATRAGGAAVGQMQTVATVRFAASKRSAQRVT